jgi:hypothetical protein
MPWQTTYPAATAIIPAGSARRHVLVRRIFDAFLSVATDWREVTNNDPTPTPLRPFASTIPSTVNNSTTPSSGQYCAAYLSTDPRIAIDGKARLMFLRVESESGTNFFIGNYVLDVACSTTTPALGGAFTFSGIALYTSGVNTATNSVEVSVFVFQRPNCAVLTLLTPSGFAGTSVYFYPDQTPYNFNRSVHPAITLVHARANVSSIEHRPPPSASGSYSSDFVYTAPDATAPDGSVPIVSLLPVMTSPQLFFLGKVPEVYVAVKTRLTGQATYGGKLVIPQADTSSALRLALRLD